MPVYRLYQKTPQDSRDHGRLQSSSTSCGWTEDKELHKRYIKWKEEVELELGSSLSNRSNSVKSNYVLRWAGKPARDYLKSLPQSEFKYEGASAEAILTALEKTKTKSNEIAAFTKLCSLKQGDMPLSEFIREARRLAELCNYRNDQDMLIRDTIVSGIHSLTAYQKCIDTKDLSLQDCINICQVEDAIRMQQPSTVSGAPTRLQPEPAQYSTPYFMSREELPQAKCNSLKTASLQTRCQ